MRSSSTSKQRTCTHMTVSLANFNPPPKIDRRLCLICSIVRIPVHLTTIYKAVIGKILYVDAIKCPLILHVVFCQLNSAHHFFPCSCHANSTSSTHILSLGPHHCRRASPVWHGCFGVSLFLLVLSRSIPPFWYRHFKAFVWCPPPTSNDDAICVAVSTTAIAS